MPRRLTRDTRQAFVGGVAAGFARYFDIDPVIARLAFVFMTFLHGAGVILYLVCWVVMPDDVRAEAGAGPAGGAQPPDGGPEPTAGEAGQAPADRFVQEVREAGERVAGGLRQEAGDPWRGQMVAGAVLVALGLLFLLPRLDIWFWPDWLRLRDIWPAVLIVAGGTMLLRSRSSAP